jgi:hypothetical protein
VTGSDTRSAGRQTRRTNVSVALNRGVFPPNRIGLVLAGQLLAFAVAFALSLPAVPFAAVMLVPVPFLQAIVVFSGRRLWPAQEATLWLSLMTADEWRRKRGEPMPRTPAQAKTWLRRNPEGSAPGEVRAGIMFVAGLLAEAGHAISRLPTESTRDRFRRLDLDLALAAMEGGPLDTGAADDAIRADIETPQIERDLHLAYHAALKAIDGGGDAIEPLTRARWAAGRPPSAYARRIWARRLSGVIAAVAIGVWVLAAVLVGLATAGGVVWF